VWRDKLLVGMSLLFLSFVGLGLPPVLGKLKNMTHSYHSGLLVVAVALIAGGVIGIIVSRPPTDRVKTPAYPQSGK